MKVFISWSGERSRQVADLLDRWIQCVLQAVDPWLSTKDIDKGSLWFSEITSQLSNTQNGIVCLTKSNLNNPWILFEAGALAKGISSNRVYTFLIDLKPNDIKDPLAQFNHTIPNKEGLYQLVRTINNGLDINSLKETILSNVFNTYFPQFESEFNTILKSTPEEEVQEERPKEELLNEILYSVRGIDKRLRKVEDTEYLHFNNTLHNNDVVRNNVKQVPIEAMDISVRAFKALKSLNLNTVDDLLMLDLSTLNAIKYNREIVNGLQKFLNIKSE